MPSPEQAGQPLKPRGIAEMEFCPGVAYRRVGIRIALAYGAPANKVATMKLRQGEIWQREGEFLRVVRVERLAVEYKAMKSLAAKTGSLHKVTKKEFCRLLKTAGLVPASGVVATKQ
jgi:hypothetical protein